MSRLAIIILGFSVFARGLWAQTQTVEFPKLLVTTGHSGRINAVAFSASGGLVASGGDDGVASVWDTATGVEIRRLSSSNGAVHYVGFSANGGLLLTGSLDQFAHLWEIKTGKEISRVAAHFSVSDSGWEGAFAFSSDGLRAFTVSGQKQAIVWKMPEGQKIATHMFATYVVGAAFSPDGQLLLFSFEDGALELWDAALTNKKWSVKNDEIGAPSVCFSPDGRRLIVGDIVPHIRDVQDGHELARLKGHEVLMLGVAWSANGKYVLTSNWDRTARLWDAETGQVLRTMQHPEPVSSSAFSPDSKTFVTASWDGHLRLWDRESGQVIPRFDVNINPVVGLGFTKDQPYVVAGSQDNVAFLWTPDSGAQMRRFSGHQAPVLSGVLSPDRQFLLTGSGDHTASIWDLFDGIEQHRLEWHEQYVMDPSFSADGGRIVTAGGHGYVWDGDTGELLRKFGEQNITAAVFRIAISPNGQRALSAGVPSAWDGMLRTWDTDSGTILSQWKSPAKNVVARFSGDNKIVLVGGENGKVEAFDSSTGKSLGGFVGHQGNVLSIEFSRDGASVITGADDHTVRIWDFRTRKELRKITQDMSVERAVLSDSGRFLLTQTTPDNVVYLWDLAGTAKETARIFTFRDGTWIAVTPDGRFDTNNLDQIPGLAWQFVDTPTHPLPVEVFLQAYYEPQLVSRLLRNQPLLVVPSLSSLDRRQPKITINSANPVEPGLLSVQIEIDGDTMVDQGSGNLRVHGLRLFRDGQLVATAPKDGAEIELGPAKPRVLLSFPPIALPQTNGKTVVELSAYGFNETGVKSTTGRKLYSMGEVKQTRKGRFYLVAMGVSANEHQPWTLSFAAKDARAITELFQKLLTAGKEYSEIVPIELLSDVPNNYDQPGPKALQATKQNLRNVLALLAGEKVDSEWIRSVPDSERLEKIRPEDTLVLFFSGHGFTARDGTFYFVPYDTGTEPFSHIEDLVQHMISSDELAQWIRPLDAGDVTLVIDACHAAETIEAYGFKPGPLGSRGLGQLAYDKGMKILAATQSNATALEVGGLRSGLLTYSIIAEGLGQKQADFQPRDGTITMNELLRYAVLRVPRIYRELRNGSLQGFSATQGRKDTAIDTDLSLPDDPKQEDSQQPALFDFRRPTHDFTIAGESPYSVPVAPYAAYLAPPDRDAEEAALRSAAGIADPAAKVRALQLFLQSYPNSSNQMVARLLLLEALMELDAPSAQLAGASRDAVTYLRDRAQRSLAWRISALAGVSQKLIERRENLEDALAFLQQAKVILKNYGGSPIPELERSYQDALKLVATTARRENQTLSLSLSPSSSGSAPLPALVFYADTSQHLAAKLAKEIEDEIDAEGLRASINLVLITPSNNPSSSKQLPLKSGWVQLMDQDSSKAAALGIFAVPTVLVADSKNVIRFRNTGFTEDFKKILKYQLAELSASKEP